MLIHEKCGNCGSTDIKVSSQGYGNPQLYTCNKCKFYHDSLGDFYKWKCPKGHSSYYWFLLKNFQGWQKRTFSPPVPKYKAILILNRNGEIVLDIKE